MTEKHYNLRVKEDLGTKKPLVANINRKRLLRHRVSAIIRLNPFGRFCVVFTELFDDIRTNVGELLLHKERVQQQHQGRTIKEASCFCQTL